MARASRRICCITRRGRSRSRPIVPVRTKSASRREAYVLTLLPLPRVDAVKALRFGLKALKRFGLQCIRIEPGDADPRQTSRAVGHSNGAAPPSDCRPLRADPYPSISREYRQG
jgi:hypothetical protein